jgi:hypothetical protein
MSVYVGIDVHRKRSQVAVVAEDGKVQLNKNTVNGTEPLLRLIGDLPAGTPVAFEAAFGWSWLAELLEAYGFEAHLVHPLRCKAIASARLKNDKGRRRDPGPAAARGPAPGGVARPGGGAPAPRAAAAPDRAGPARHPAAQPDPRGGGRFRLRPVRQLPVRAGPRLAGRARFARGLPGDRDRRPGGHRRPGAADRPDRRRAAPARQGRPAGQGPDHAAGGRPVHRAGDGGRDRRHHPVRKRPQAGQLGRADAHGPRLGPDRPARAHHPSRARPGCAGCSTRRPRPPGGPPSSPPPTPASPSAAGRRSPPSRSPASC